MKDSGKIVQFEIPSIDGVTVTHGYAISHTFPMHFHATCSVGIIESGCREFCFRGDTYRLEAGDVFVLQPYDPHSCQSPEGTTNSYKVISFAVDSSLYFPSLLVNDEQLLTMLRKFHALAEYDQQSSTLVPLFDAIKARLESFSVACSRSVRTDELEHMAAAKLYIEENCSRDLSIGEVAAHVNLSKFHFIRLFRQCYGMSPHAYELMCRVKVSQRLLRNRSAAIEAGYETGFFDQSHFIKEFKRQVGVTPGRFCRDNIR